MNSILKDVNIIDKKIVVKDDFKDICFNSSDTAKGKIFVAIKGHNVDGHDYVKKAIEKGVKTILVERFLDFDVNQYKVADTKEALSKMSANLFLNPSKKMKVIAVTATNGKTTTTNMIYHVLNKKEKVGIIGTVEVKYFDKSYPSTLTTPDAYNLQKHLYNMQKEGIEYVVMELSSIGIEQHRSSNIFFSVLAFNNIQPEHIDYHKTFDNYFNEKKSVFLKEENADIVLNMDDKLIEEFSKELKGKKVFKYSLKNKALISAKDIELYQGSLKYKLIYKKKEYFVDMNVGGIHNVYNSLSSILCLLKLGYNIEFIIDSLKDFVGIERRFELIYENDFSIIDDHFANVNNIKASIDSLKRMDYKGLNLVLAVRGNRGIDVNLDMANMVVELNKNIKVKNLILTISRDYTEKKDYVKKEELDIFLKTFKSNKISYTLYNNLKDAVVKGVDLTDKEDILFLAGAQGMDYGGYLALDYISDKKNIKKEDVFKKIENRVVGIIRK